MSGLCGGDVPHRIGSVPFVNIGYFQPISYLDTRQVRYGQLMKQQEKMIRDMEASVSRREVIALRGEGQNKRDKKLVPKSVFHCKKQELRKKISKAQKNIQDCNATLLELESAQASLGAAFLEKQRELRRLEPE
ncbi:coiled-coil domain-containing protein 40-like, partial [Leptosomus discolor]